MDTLRQDLAYALRRLAHAPGFSFVAVATLALGIGANSAIFSVIDAVLLRPLPFPEPDRLVMVSQTWEGKPTVYSPQNFLDLAASAGTFESLAAFTGGGITLTGRGAPARIEGSAVSASFFDVLRVRPVLGRGFLAEENEPGRNKVVVLGHVLWRSRFGGDPALVGRTVDLNRQPHLVVGIAPPGFSYPEGKELWTPMEYDPVFRSHSRGAWYLTVIGRLQPGATVEAARQEVETIAARLARAYPDQNEGVGGTVRPLHQALVGPSRTALLVLLGAVGLVLLIACVNVANLLLARAAARETEMAVRAALGAGRRRLIRQLVTESLVLATLGGVAGVLLASASLGSLLALQPAGVPRLDEVHIDRSVMAFAAALSVLTGILFGLFPAWHATARPTAQTLREGSRGLLAGPGQRLRGGLVVAQLALAMTLLAGAGLLLRSFDRLRRVDPGFRPESALTFRLSLPESAYPEEPRRTAFFRELLTRLEALPGVRRAGAVMGIPLGGLSYVLSFEVEGRPKLPPAQQPSMQVRVATPGYFETMGIPLVRGRSLQPQDAADAPTVVVLSETAVRRFFPGEDPIGQRIVVGWRRPDGLPPAGGQVVGIVGDVKELGLDQLDPPEVYIPYAQLPTNAMDVVLRTSVDPLSMTRSVAAVVAGLDVELPVARLQTLDAVVARSVSEPRFYMLLLGAFAAMAVSLAALGIFGVMSYAVVQRRREIGIRVALGAHPRDVLGMVLRHALLLTLSGVGLGLLGALAFSRVIASLLFRLSPTDPTTLVTVGVVLTAVALLASYLPARRATRVDPLAALRSE
jgi:putative ABC transport system permease protein